jgi:Putative phage serine protease XkdF
MKFKPTEAVKENMLRGIVLKNKYKRESIASKSTEEIVKQAQGILDNGFDMGAVKKMYWNLQKLENSDFKTRLHDGGPKEEVIKFYAMGGSAGLAWCRKTLKDAGVLVSYTKEISEADTQAQGTDDYGKIPVAKSLDEELKQATFVVMAPDEVDLHGDITSEEEVRKACHNFNKYCQKANLFHLVQTETFEFCESYVCLTDMVLGDKEVKKGTWLCTIQCLDDDLWTLIKSGEINGVSIGAMAAVEDLEDE